MGSEARGTQEATRRDARLGDPDAWGREKGRSLPRDSAGHPRAGEAAHRPSSTHLDTDFPLVPRAKYFKNQKEPILPSVSGEGRGGHSPAQDEGDVDEGGEVRKELQREELDGELALSLREGPRLLWDETWAGPRLSLAPRQSCAWRPHPSPVSQVRASTLQGQSEWRRQEGPLPPPPAPGPRPRVPPRPPTCPRRPALRPLRSP